MASNPAAWPRAPLSPSYCVCINNVGEAPRRVILLVVYAIALPPGCEARSWKMTKNSEPRGTVGLRAYAVRKAADVPWK